MSIETTDPVEVPAEVVASDEDVSTDVVAATPDIAAVAPEPEPAKPAPVEEYVIPMDTINALRLIRRNKLLEADDDAYTRQHITNLVVTWISQKRAGTTNQELDVWLSTPDVMTIDEDDDDPESVDPT